MSAPTNSHASPDKSHLSASVTVDQLFNAAFSNSRDPRSGEYMDGARAALAYRVDGTRIGSPYPVGTAAADAFFSGIDEGHGIWRRSGGTHHEAPSAGAAQRRQLLDIEGNAVDIGAQLEHIDILLQSVFEKLDDVDGKPSAPMLAAINCYVTCAMRGAMLIGQAKDQIIALATEGGAP